MGRGLKYSFYLSWEMGKKYNKSYELNFKSNISMSDHFRNFIL